MQTLEGQAENVRNYFSGTSFLPTNMSQKNTNKRPVRRSGAAENLRNHGHRQRQERERRCQKKTYFNRRSSPSNASSFLGLQVHLGVTDHRASRRRLVAGQPKEAAPSAQLARRGELQLQKQALTRAEGGGSESISNLAG